MVAVFISVVIMLTLTEDQYKKFLASDVQNFIAAVADEFLSEREDMRGNPGRSEVILRMQSAYDNGLNLGFTSTGHLIYMMYMSADYPKLFERPETQRYLSKSGALPEQRLDEMKSVLRHLGSTVKQREEESRAW
ncbi:hypothetical protein C798_25740 [Herbaspirillum rubrisubalbicans Os34]|jgi:hypothetical protein|uniref:Uncharacterized protein n=2 Tax=Herbaspirillum rubrisubalbicans TaxID=80842 RepID=A0A6M3ZXW9_9BURK|nr:hypothetical protein C798_25740 [Herbaspirillum rubrisubalbicans Os34]